ncbi:unnamed protein product [Leptidea sinapis]|uniref:Uncharacterized protein n=1 Tax=Leptidea sinapis TaxID=189913 RepID=A0A5E4QPW9_9NEOP|nr:unnamed protein product [Leptidea sinapis]
MSFLKGRQRSCDSSGVHLTTGDPYARLSSYSIKKEMCAPRLSDGSSGESLGSYAS